MKTPKAQSERENAKLDCMTIKNFLSPKEPIRKYKANYKLKKSVMHRLISLIKNFYKKSQRIQQKKQ